MEPGLGEGVLGVKVKVKSKSELVLAPPPPCVPPLLRIHNPGTTKTSRQGKVEIKGVDGRKRLTAQGGAVVCRVWQHGVCVYICVSRGEK